MHERDWTIRSNEVVTVKRNAQTLALAFAVVCVRMLPYRSVAAPKVITQTHGAGQEWNHY